MATETSERRRNPLRKIILSLMLCLLALTVGAVVFLSLAALRQPPPSREPVQRVYNVEVFEARPCDIQEIVTGFGTARSDREVVVCAEVSGQVITVHPKLEVGQSVQGALVTVDEAGQSHRIQGDALVQIDPRTYQERLTQILNSLAEDEVQLGQLEQEEKNLRRLLKHAEAIRDDYKKEFDRIARLVQQKVLQSSDYTRALLELRRYEQAVTEYENQLALIPTRREAVLQRMQTRRTEQRLAELDVERTTVRPPFSGIISEVFVEVGKVVRPGDPLFRLTDITQVEVPVALSLSDYAKLAKRIKEGDFPYVELAENETAPARWVGELTRAAPEADETTRTIQVYVEVDNRKQSTPLLPGAFVHARIDGPVLKSVMLVPRDALTEDGVFVAVPRRPDDLSGPVVARKRPIVIRRTLQSFAILDSKQTPLQPGDQVILTNLDILQDEAEVRVQSRRTLKDELRRQRVPVAKLIAATEEISPPSRSPLDRPRPASHRPL
ncbi:MAG: efflux RND transporter periplasmic adaptor subunit [Planctomycetes bacterium]|nr:efflux RND transporter periplasmic adaptor subunit [Planctomycetota bacterium]